MYMMNDREFSNRKETLHGEFYENALKYPERIALAFYLGEYIAESEIEDYLKIHLPEYSIPQRALIAATNLAASKLSAPISKRFSSKSATLFFNSSNPPKRILLFQNILNIIITIIANSTFAS